MNIKYYLLKPIKSACVILIGASLAFSVSSCTDDDDDDTNTPAVNAQDADFAVRATYSNYNEISLGNIAKVKGQSPLVRDYGNKMVIHHTDANGKFAPIATRKGVSLPAGPDALHVTIANKLNALPPAKFDSAYISGQVVDHDVTRNLFEVEINNGKDADIKKFAQDNIALINAHLRSADSIHKAIVK